MNEPELLRELADEDPELRRRAVITLGLSPMSCSSSALMQALGDPEWRVRKEAVRVAREQAVSLGLLPPLVDAICQGDNVGLRNAALDVLEKLGADAADALIGALPTVSPETKKFVIEALACGGDPRVVTTLIETSRGADVMTAVTAIEALSMIGGPATIEALVLHLKSAEALIRMAALDGLNRLGTTLTWTQLEPLLSDRMARRVAVTALGRSGQHEAITPLEAALDDRSLHMVRAAVVSLAQLARTAPELSTAVERMLAQAPEGARARIRDLASDIDSAVREAAVELLIAAHDEQGLGDVVELAVTDMLSPSAHEGLRRWGKPLSRLLLASLEGPGERARATALELASDAALDALSSTVASDVTLVAQVRQALRDAIASESPTLTLAAARCMGAWAEASDAALLVGVASRLGEDVAYACGRALSRLAERAPAAVQAVVEVVALDGPAGAPLTMLIASLGGPNAVSRLQVALSAQDPTTRKAAIEGLASLPDPTVAELIAFALTDDSVDVQMTAARALGALRDAEGKPIGMDRLLLALNSESDGVRASAARALGATGDMRSLAPLRDLVQQGNSGVVVAAIEGLRALGDTDIGALLNQALKHDDEEVVKQALYALADVRAPGHVERIAEALGHRAWDVRGLAAELLAGLGDRSAVGLLRHQLDREVDDLVRDVIGEALKRLGEG
jgi:HEAT repeat protein